MYSLISKVPLSTVVGRELPAFGISLVVAEIFYKFQSFSLECLAFLATWFGLSWLIGRFMPEKRG